MSLTSYIRNFFRVGVCAVAIVVAVAVSSHRCFAGATSPKPSKSAKKALKQAERLVNSADKAAEARGYIKEALADSVLAADAKTYYIAGKIEAGQFNEDLKHLSINRNDPKVDKVRMGDALMSARDYYIKAMERDTTIDSKGRVQTRYSDQLDEWINAQTPHYYNAGIAYLNKKLYYPQAYNAFLAYAETPRNSSYVVTDSARAKAYFYAGVMAFNAKEYKVSAESFAHARQYHYPRKEVLINEMVCLRRIADADSTFLPEAMDRITSISREGVDRFGVNPPLFVQKYVAGRIHSGDFIGSIAMIDSLSNVYPSSKSLLYSLRGVTKIAMRDTVAAIDDFVVASEDSTALFQTLLFTSKLMARKGISELSSIRSTGRHAKKESRQLKEKWLKPARQYAERAKGVARKRDGIYGELTDDAVEEMTRDLENTIATIEYYILR